MTVLDACALVAYFRDEPAAKPVSELLGAPTVLSVVNAAEVVDQLVASTAWTRTTSMPRSSCLPKRPG
jgi:PIN domain nuclease of toxin-antitoxin system